MVNTIGAVIGDIENRSDTIPNPKTATATISSSVMADPNWCGHGRRLVSEFGAPVLDNTVLWLLHETPRNST